MSRMSKFLRQTCRYEAARTNSKGESVLNEYGEYLYKPAVVLKCRKELLSKTVQTAEGELVTSTTRYYLDSTREVKVNDRLDGRAIVSVANFINERGINEGFECYV